MQENMISLSDIEKYLQLFRGREDIFAQQRKNSYFPIHRSLDEYFIRQHLMGNLTLGLYLLNNASCCHLVCIDIDIPKRLLDQVDFTDPDQKYAYLKEQINVVLEVLKSKLMVPANSILVEETGGRGYHIWIFFDEPVDGQNAVKFGMKLKSYLEFDIEFFPKQGQLSSKRNYGNLIKLPLGIHRKYGLRSFFISGDTDTLCKIIGEEKNFTLLRTVVPMSSKIFEDFVSNIVLNFAYPEVDNLLIHRPDQPRPQFVGDPEELINRCAAMRYLCTKAESGTRFSGIEAFHLTNIMLSLQGGAGFVHSLMRLSFTKDYDKKRTQKEIDNISLLYPTNCLTLVQQEICPGFCKESVRKKNEDPLVPGTNPGSVWLRRKPNKPITDPDNLVEQIGDIKNIRQSFFQLRQYHEHEDSLFFDPFDFEQFESRLDSNCMMLAKSIIERIIPTFFGYMPVAIPKKISDEQKLEYRGMSYSTVYDQLPIQSIFNGVAPFLEIEFQPTSYGYRWNLDQSSSCRIFEDWRETYPRFRKDIMTVIERHSNGYYICCDIKAYYDHVDHNILLEQLRKLIPDPYVFQVIERTIGAYKFTKDLDCGLPQGPAYARILANLYLNNFDIYAEDIAVAYFRYVDDFILVFDNKSAAEKGLDLVVTQLTELCLELSQDETKRAVITPNTDISKIRKTLDKIHYGILEGTRHIEHLAPKAVSDFMEAVERHSVSPVNIEELIQINDALPSLLYTSAQKSLHPNKLQSKIIDIIEFLIKRHWFCPKKLKVICYRILDIESDENRLYDFFQAMEPAHKVYFLLCVYGSWQSRGEHQTLLERLLQTSLKEENVYVLGFAISISSKLGIVINDFLENRILMNKFTTSNGRFALLKWLPTISYLEETDDERAVIRKIIDPRSPELLRILLISNLKKLPSVYADSIYVSGLIMHWSVLVIPVACELLITADDKGEVFNNLIKLMTEHLAFKKLTISLISRMLFEKRSSAGLAEVQNLKSLYECISDRELKQCMLKSLSRIMQYGLHSDEEFAKQHKEIDRYHECFLFKSMNNNGQYDYLELIPFRRFYDFIPIDFDTFKAIIEDFDIKKILPNPTLFYDSSKEEFSIEYKTDNHYHELDSADFSLKDVSVTKACILVTEIYRKACYFHQITGRAPLISPKNLLVDEKLSTVVFRTIGRSLSGSHVINDLTIGYEKYDIAEMLAKLLETLLFESQIECENFLKSKPHQGVHAFLQLFMWRLKTKNIDRRYSCSRFSYLVDQLNLPQDAQQSQFLLEVRYLRERLKGGLSRYNKTVVTWQGICRALDDHLGQHLQYVCSKEAFQEFPYRSQLLVFEKGKRKLHKVSRQLINFTIYRKDFLDVEITNPTYLDLLEYLLLFASICIELISLARINYTPDILERVTSSALMLKNKVKIIAGDYEIEVSPEDLAELSIRQPKKKTDEPATSLSLRQLSLLALLACRVEIGESTITVTKSKGFGNEVFQSFAHASLIRIPKIELTAKNEINEILTEMRSNGDFRRIESLNELRKDVNILAEDLCKVRTCFGLSRRFGRVDGKYFPPVLRCRSLFRRVLRVKDYTLPGCSLTNNFPSSQQGYNCSWDLIKKEPINLIVPSVGVHSLVQALKCGKIFGHKLSSLYSGKKMLFWDVTVFLLIAMALWFCENPATSITTVKLILSILPYVLSVMLSAVFIKIVLLDISHWSLRYRKAVQYIMSKNKSKM